MSHIHVVITGEYKKGKASATLNGNAALLECAKISFKDLDHAHLWLTQRGFSQESRERSGNIYAEVWGLKF